MSDNQIHDDYNEFLEGLLREKKQQQQGQQPASAPKPKAAPVKRQTPSAQGHSAQKKPSAASVPPQKKPAAPQGQRPSSAQGAKPAASPRPQTQAQQPRPARPPQSAAPAAKAPASKPTIPAANNMDKTMQVPVRKSAPHPGGTPSKQPPRATTPITDADGTLVLPGEATEPNRPRRDGGNTARSFVKIVTYLVAVLVVSVILGVGAIFIGNDIYAFVKSDAEMEITIPENATHGDIAKILAENDLIEYPAVFKIYAGFKKYTENYVAGTYTVSPAMNYKEFIFLFKPKQTVSTVSITIPEGFTTDEIIDLFLANGIGTKEGFVDAINNYDFNYWFVDELEGTLPEERFYRLDGYLFPDTYYFYTNASEVDVITKLLDNFNKRFDESYRLAAYEHGYTVDQIITLASIIEKETKFASEQANVSSVFHNRLKNAGNFPYLESDATIVYAIHHNTGTRPTELSKADLEYDSPYNSYTHRGLPPGAICSPSLNAIIRALDPAKTTYYYFVADKEGHSIFSSTYAEHQIAISKVNAQ